MSPPPPGDPGEDYDYDDDIEGVTFYTAYRVDGALVRDHRGCESYYNAQYSLGWDLDDNGSFESSGTSVTFSAAPLDGPSTAAVQARAAHPTDTSTVGTGVPIPVAVAGSERRAGDRLRVGQGPARVRPRRRRRVRSRACP